MSFLTNWHLLLLLAGCVAAFQLATGLGDTSDPTPADRIGIVAEVRASVHKCSLLPGAIIGTRPAPRISVFVEATNALLPVF